MAGLRREFIHECRNGHRYDAESTLVREDGTRTCRICRRQREAAKRRRRRLERERTRRQELLETTRTAPLLPAPGERALRSAEVVGRPAADAVSEFHRLRGLGIDAPRAHLLAAGSYQAALPGARRNPREHGSERGWRQHRTDGSPACRACRAAHSRHNLAARITAVPVAVSA